MPSKVETFGGEAVGYNLELYGRQKDGEVQERLEQRAREIETWMKANHRWQNVTGRAEQSLEAYVTRIGGLHVLVWRGGETPDAPHVYWLTFAMGRRFDIFTPTAARFVPILTQDMREIFGPRGRKIKGPRRSRVRGRGSA